MPTVPAMPPADRFYARLIRFECACPSCGQLIVADPQPVSLTKAARQLARQQGQGRRSRRLIWNRYTQRLRCPACTAPFVAGLLLYPSPPTLHDSEPPPDVVQTPRERLALRQQAGGYEPAARTIGQPVNLHVAAPCSCPPKGWLATCPIHGASAAPVPSPLEQRIARLTEENRRLAEAAPPVPHESLT